MEEMVAVMRLGILLTVLHFQLQVFANFICPEQMEVAQGFPMAEIIGIKLPRGRGGCKLLRHVTASRFVLVLFMLEAIESAQRAKKLVVDARRDKAARIDAKRMAVVIARAPQTRVDAVKEIL